VEAKLRALSPKQTALLVLWLIFAMAASFFVAVTVSGSVLAMVS